MMSLWDALRMNMMISYQELVRTFLNTIMREYPNGEKTHLTVMAAGFPSLTGDHKVIYVAADRHVTSEEILEAAIRLLS